MKDNDLVVCINKIGWSDDNDPFSISDGPKYNDICTIEYEDDGYLAFYEWSGVDADGTRTQFNKKEFVPLNAPTVDEIVEAINSHHMSNIS